MRIVLGSDRTRSKREDPEAQSELSVLEHLRSILRKSQPNRSACSASNRAISRPLHAAGSKSEKMRLLRSGTISSTTHCILPRCGHRIFPNRPGAISCAGPPFNGIRRMRTGTAFVRLITDFVDQPSAIGAFRRRRANIVEPGDYRFRGPRS